MIALFLATTIGTATAIEPLKVGVFAIDASPPVGSPDGLRVSIQMPFP